MQTRSFQFESDDGSNQTIDDIPSRQQGRWRFSIFLLCEFMAGAWSELPREKSFQWKMWRFLFPGLRLVHEQSNQMSSTQSQWSKELSPWMLKGVTPVDDTDPEASKHGHISHGPNMIFVLLIMAVTYWFKVGDGILRCRIVNEMPSSYPDDPDEGSRRRRTFAAADRSFSDIGPAADYPTWYLQDRSIGHAVLFTFGLWFVSQVLVRVALKRKHCDEERFTMKQLFILENVFWLMFILGNLSSRYFLLHIRQQGDNAEHPLQLLIYEVIWLFRMAVVFFIVAPILSFPHEPLHNSVAEGIFSMCWGWLLMIAWQDLLQDDNCNKVELKNIAAKLPFDLAITMNILKHFYTTHSFFVILGVILQMAAHDAHAHFEPDIFMMYAGICEMQSWAQFSMKALILIVCGIGLPALDTILDNMSTGTTESLVDLLIDCVGVAFIFLVANTYIVESNYRMPTHFQGTIIQLATSVGVLYFASKFYKYWNYKLLELPYEVFHYLVEMLAYVGIAALTVDMVSKRLHIHWDLKGFWSLCFATISLYRWIQIESRAQLGIGKDEESEKGPVEYFMLHMAEYLAVEGALFVFGAWCNQQLEMFEVEEEEEEEEADANSVRASGATTKSRVLGVSFVEGSAQTDIRRLQGWQRQRANTRIAIATAGLTADERRDSERTVRFPYASEMARSLEVGAGLGSRVGRMQSDGSELTSAAPGGTPNRRHRLTATSQQHPVSRWGASLRSNNIRASQEVRGRKASEGNQRLTVGATSSLRSAKEQSMNMKRSVQSASEDAGLDLAALRPNAKTSKRDYTKMEAFDKQLICDLFSLFDDNGTGVLNSRQLFRLAMFCGYSDEVKWEEEDYRRMCTDRGWIPTAGISLDQFMTLLEEHPDVHPYLSVGGLLEFWTVRARSDSMVSGMTVDSGSFLT